MKRILLINQGKTENLGDKAINIIFRDILNENNCIVDFAGFGQTIEQNMNEMRTNWKYDIRHYIKKCIPNSVIWLLKYTKRIKSEFNNIAQDKSYDLVIIGGGQLIKTKCVFVYLLLSWYNILNKHLDCPIIIAGVGADTNYSFLEKEVYKRLLPKFDKIYVRDNKSQKILYKYFQIEAKYIPDIVFDFSKFYPNKENLVKDKFLIMIYNYETLKKNFGTKYSKEDYYNVWLDIIMKNIDPQLEVILGYTTIGDKIETFSFSNYLAKNTELKFSVKNTDDLESFAEVLKETKKLISGRMHGMLLGINYDCEIIPFIVSPKIEAFNKEWIETKINIKEINNNIDSKIKDILNFNLE